MEALSNWKEDYVWEADEEADGEGSKRKENKE